MFNDEENQEILEDVLKNDLDIVFCGIAAGKESAKQKVYYAGRGNKFWEILSEVKLIDKSISQDNYKDILKRSIGLTDLVKDQFGGEVLISVKNKDRQQLEEKILRYKPKILAFNGKKVAMEYFKSKHVPYGIHKEKIGGTSIFVLPSTSSMANGSWDIKYWKELASLINKY